ncbi:unnamed protein product [Protopolystoma xenopodis]|uniref:Uncharacterized protein n=1 Tax=Protopolystoma xenopodis TaxID=117903 RepID=A0A3S5AUK9_9PLAT|nr:unnamed protein product [Protopolystoma xenopodis]
MRVFVTSFGPFGDHKVNPSSQAVKKLKEIWESRSELSGSDLELNTITDVQVAYDTCRDLTEMLWKNRPVHYLSSLLIIFLFLLPNYNHDYFTIRSYTNLLCSV